MKNCLLLFLFIPLFGTSQNLISNGSFEDTVSCPPGFGYLESAVNWLDPITSTSSDLIHDCAQVCNPVTYGQAPRTGSAYAALIIYYDVNNMREYIEVPIDSPLISGECYHVEFYMSAGFYKFATDDIQVYFSDTLIFNVFTPSSLFSLTPQFHNTTGNFPDTTNWTKVEGDYIAQGTENYMLIGNFKDSSNTNVIVINPQNNNGFAYVYIDDVSLTHIICTGVNEISNSSVLVSPNPSKDNARFEINSNQLFELQIFDSASRLCYSTPFQKEAEIDVSAYKSGIYFYRFVNNKSILTGKLFVY